VILIFQPTVSSSIGFTVRMCRPQAQEETS
jgi:hypothetical protein